jgi:hypothetical protein
VLAVVVADLYTLRATRVDRVLPGLSSAVLYQAYQRFRRSDQVRVMVGSSLT